MQLFHLHTNAEAERIFSIVTNVKNKNRNRMNFDLNFES